MTPAKRKEEDSKTFSELFNEALDSTPQKQSHPSPAGTPGTPNYASSNAFVPQSQMKLMQQQQRGFNDTPLASAPIFQPPQPPQPPQQPSHGDEMDWSPSQPAQTQTQHRAFRSSPEHREPPRPFGQSPTQGDGKNPFWFKVPAAPSNPARQLRNPSNMPVLRKKPVEKDDVFFTSRRDSQEYRRRGGSSGSQGGSASTSFKNPSFFAPEEHDEANSLADLLGQSFSLSQEQQPPAEAATSLSLGSRSGGQTASTGSPPRTELVALAVLLPLWLLLSALPSLPYHTELRSLILVGAGVIALSGTGETQQQSQQQQPPQTPKLADAVFSTLGVAELAGVCWVGWETWAARVDVSGYGAGVLAVMLGHNAFKARAGA